LPPIDPVQYRRTPVSRQADAEGSFHLYQPEKRDVETKRVRYEADYLNGRECDTSRVGGLDYIHFPDGKLQSQASRKSSRNPAISTQTLMVLPIQKYMI
jgi:hypothetical protein